LFLKNKTTIKVRKMNKRILLIAAIIVLAAAAVLGGFYYSKNRQEQNVSNNTNSAEPKPEQQVVKKDLKPDEVPEKFPTNIPIEKDAPIVQNFSATTATHIQATRSFVSKLPIEANLKLYTDYLVKNGYTVSPFNTDTLKSVIGRKDNTMLQIAVEQNSTNKVVTVTISYSEKLAK
jgi:hypothetical protein